MEVVFPMVGIILSCWYVHMSIAIVSRYFFYKYWKDTTNQMMSCIKVSLINVWVSFIYHYYYLLLCPFTCDLEVGYQF